MKCIDFTNQFTGYVDYMSQWLQSRRIESEPFVKRETNKPWNKTKECIWNDEHLLTKAEKYLKHSVIDAWARTMRSQGICKKFNNMMMMCRNAYVCRMLSRCVHMLLYGNNI